MPILDLSGPTNGLIILSSVSLAITQFFYSDLKARHSDAQSRVKAVFDKNTSAFSQSMRDRYDIIINAKLRTIRHEMSCLFFILFASGLIKTVDLVDLFFNGRFTWQTYIIGSLILATALCSGLLGWIAIAVKMMGRAVRDVEARVETLCDQVIVVVEARGGSPAAPANPNAAPA